MPRFLPVIGLFFVWLASTVSPVFADKTQNISLGVANYVPVQGKNIKNGDIVSFTNKGYFLTSTPYDPLVIGIVALNPAVSLSIQDDKNSNYPIVSSGNVELNVSSFNGNIKEGDLITSSSAKGVGMKADKSGYVIGTAIDAYSSKDKKAIGKINISLNLHYSYSTSRTISSLKDIFNLSLLATYETPSAVFKYAVAGTIILLSFLLGVLSFGRVANTGIKALGRNPLAGKMIQFGILVNVLISIAIIIAGFGMAYLIIRL